MSTPEANTARLVRWVVYLSDLEIGEKTEFIFSKLAYNVLTMLRRTGHWWNRRRVWYYDETFTKTADRPHPITIIMACLSPVLAVVATIVSIQSLQTSQQSMQVGQRAYLGVLDQKALVLPNATLYNLSGGIEDARDKAYELQVELKCQLFNEGNTPATIDMLNVSLLKDEPGVDPSESVLDTVTTKLPQHIEQKHSKLLTIKTIHKWPTDYQWESTHARYTLFYYDVFKVQHTLEWDVHAAVDTASPVAFFDPLYTAPGISWIDPK